MIIVGEFLEKINGADRVRVMEQEEEIYIGFCGTLKHDKKVMDRIEKREIVRLRAFPEIVHKKWKELNLMKPLEPEEAADFKFSDLEMKLYYAIYI